MISDIEIIIASIGLLLGLPHGTYDWLIISRWWGGKVDYFDFIITTVIYTVIGVPYIILWFIYPGPALILFLILTALHWGQEELYHSLTEVDVIGFKGLWHKLVYILGRGGITVVYPLLFYHEDYEYVMNVLLSLFNAEGNISWLFTPPVRATLICLVTLSMVIYTIFLNDAKDIFMTIKSSVWFIAVPVAISIPVYLTMTHSVIHMERYWKMSNDMTFKQLALESIPYGVGAIFLYVMGLLIIPSASSSLLNMTALYMVLLAVLTLPHFLLCVVLDIEQRLYGDGHRVLDI